MTDAAPAPSPLPALQIASAEMQASLRAQLPASYDDYTYLLSDEDWLRDCKHPKLDNTQYETVCAVHRELQKVEIDRINKRFTQNLLKLRAGSAEANRVLRVILFASVVRTVIIRRYLASDTPPEALDREEFIVDAGYHLRGMTANELLWLPRYRRAMSVAHTLLEAQSKKQFFLDTCAYLEGSFVQELGRPLEYITGSKASDATRRRVRVYERVTGVLPVKRPERALAKAVQAQQEQQGEREKEEEDTDAHSQTGTQHHHTNTQAQTHTHTQSERVRETATTAVRVSRKRGRPRKSETHKEKEKEKERERETIVYDSSTELDEDTHRDTHKDREGESYWPLCSQDTLRDTAAQVSGVPLRVQHSLSAAPSSSSSSSSAAALINNYSTAGLVEEYNNYNNHHATSTNSAAEVLERTSTMAILLDALSDEPGFALPPAMPTPATLAPATVSPATVPLSSAPSLSELFPLSSQDSELMRLLSVSSQTIGDLLQAAQDTAPAWENLDSEPQS